MASGSPAAFAEGRHRHEREQQGTIAGFFSERLNGFDAAAARSKITFAIPRYSLFHQQNRQVWKKLGGFGEVLQRFIVAAGDNQFRCKIPINRNRERIKASGELELGERLLKLALGLQRMRVPMMGPCRPWIDLERSRQF